MGIEAMIQGINRLGVKVAFTVTVLGTLGSGLLFSKTPIAQPKLTVAADCSSTVVQICRSQIVDAATGTVISISRLQPNK